MEELVDHTIKLPWKNEDSYNNNFDLNQDVSPGEYVVQTLFLEFCTVTDRKIEQVLAEPLERSLSKSLQRSEDPQLDQVLSSLGCVAEQSLPSLLSTLFKWYKGQFVTDETLFIEQFRHKNKGDRDYLCEKRDLAVEFVYCLALTEVLSKLYYHPGHDDLVNQIIPQAFRHFSYKDGIQSSPNAANINLISDLYAEVIGVLAQSRFTQVRKNFLNELKDLKCRDQSTSTSQSIISLLRGLKFFRVKMHPIEDFQACFQFLHELGHYFLEIRDKDIRHAMAMLFVEILLPVAAKVKTEVNVPILKTFVDMLYTTSIDMATKKKHTMHLFPLVTCLLSVSQKQFFLNNWPYFLTMCLSQLKNKDPKISRVALESLYRLLWVYMVRIKCESNTATVSRLQSIVNSLFPKGSKLVTPRDTPLNIFVKIIQFIAKERLDFAMKEIIYDLLCVGRPIKFLTPERMSIGLRAFLVIADSLEQKDGDPPMPQSTATLPSGSTVRIKRTFLNKMLTDETARRIGLSGYHSHILKTFDSILRALDLQVGRTFLLTKVEHANKEAEDILTGDRKPKIDLFRTCVAAIPRMLPDTMSSQELVEMLTRLTVHVDDELKGLAFQALQNLMQESPLYRQLVIRGFVSFIQQDLSDLNSQLLDGALRMLVQLLARWKHTSAAPNKTSSASVKNASVPDVTEEMAEPNPKNFYVLHEVEGLALVMLCSIRLVTRKLALLLLKEVRCILTTTESAQSGLSAPCLLDMMNQHSLAAMKMILPYLPASEKAAVLVASNIDLQWILDRAAHIWSAPKQNSEEIQQYTVVNTTFSHPDPWVKCLVNIVSPPSYPLSSSSSLPSSPPPPPPSSSPQPPPLLLLSAAAPTSLISSQCPTAIAYAWTVVYSRLQSLFPLVDLSAQSNDNRASSILRSGSKKVNNETETFLHLWHSYTVLACSLAQQGAQLSSTYDFSSSLELNANNTNNNNNNNNGNVTPTNSNNSSNNAATAPNNNSSIILNNNSSDKTESKCLPTNIESKAQNLFRLLVPLMKSEHSDMRDIVVSALGHTNPAVFKELMEELQPLIKESSDKKADKMKQKRKRDLLRSQLARIFELLATNQAFTKPTPGGIDTDNHSLNSTLTDYIEDTRLYLETATWKDSPSLKDIRLHFSGFIQQLIWNTPLNLREKLFSKSVKESLFHLMGSWTEQLNPDDPACEYRSSKKEPLSDLEIAAVGAMCAILCCGPVFDVSGLNEDGYIYNLLNTFLTCENDQVYNITIETVTLLLEFNYDGQNVLDWVIDCCYTGTTSVADGCLSALLAVFKTREYPCDHVSMLNLAVMHVGCPRIKTHETALELLQLLDTRFFQDAPVFVESCDDAVQQLKPPLNDIKLAVSYSRSQSVLTEQLSKLHPDLTMPMFSEMSHRFQTAKPALRQVLLQCLLPWLYNMELIDASLNTTASVSPNSTMKSPPPQPPPPPQAPPSLIESYSVTSTSKTHLKGEGWGSAQATEMVLNNLFYITVKFGDEHPREIEQLWSTLVQSWPNNLRVIRRYLAVMSNLAPATLLPYAKRVMSFMARAIPESVIDELMIELQTIESMKYLIERTQPPPFYRVTNYKDGHIVSDVSDKEKINGNYKSQVPLLKGMLHTKRHNTNEDLSAGSSPRPESMTSLRSTSTDSSVVSVKDQNEDDKIQCNSFGDNIPLEMSLTDINTPEAPVPYPLPMPAYGGYFAPMSVYLPEVFSPTSGHHRSNLSIMFLSHLVLDGLDIDWLSHLPLMLHISFLGLDHYQPIVYEHCKHLLENLMLLLVAREQQSIAKVLINHRRNNSQTADLHLGHGEFLKDGCTVSEFLMNTQKIPASNQTAENDNNNINGNGKEELPGVEDLETLEDTVLALLNFMDSKVGKPLWSYEDITPKNLRTESSASLEYMLKLVVKIFRDIHPLAMIEQRWSQIALHLSLSCSSRHYAGRCLQILRALQICPSGQMLSDILSRLIETVSDEGEDMQGYVTEIMLTLESLVDNLDIDFCSFDTMRDLFISTPNLAKDIPAENRRSAFISQSQYNAHARSTSYTVVPSNVKEARVRAVSEADKLHPSKINSHSNTNSLRAFDQTNADNKHSLVTQIFWLAVSMLESDYEYEFYMAIRLLEKILRHIQPDRLNSRDKLEEILQQIKWNNFPGVQTLLFKGYTSPNLAIPTCHLLSQLTLYVSVYVIDPTKYLGFPLNVISLLPYLVQNYEDPGKKCRQAAENISKMCTQLSEQLENLATVMSLYSRGTFNKDSLQWTKCVVKYLLDVYLSASLSMVTLLVEILEKGPTTFQPAILQILHCLVHYIDFKTISQSTINQRLFCPVAKLSNGTYWKEALKILKLAVNRSSTLAAAPQPHPSTTASSDLSNFSAHTSGAYIKKELPGRTLDVSVDLSRMPLIGQKYMNAELLHHSEEDKMVSLLAITRKQSTSVQRQSSWKTPHLSRAKTRERLINLLSSFGQRVGLLKSMSVIFSQSSDIPQQPSAASSRDNSTASVNSSSDLFLGDPNCKELMLTFKGFDFLDNELEEVEVYDSYSIDKQKDDYFSLGDRRCSLNLDATESSSTLTFFGSVPDLKLLDHFTDSKCLTLKDNSSFLEEVYSDESQASGGDEDDGMPHVLNKTSTPASYQHPTLNKRKIFLMNSPSPVSDAEPSLTSQPTPPTQPQPSQQPSTTPAPLPPPLSFSLSTISNSAFCFSIHSEAIEELWKTHLSNVLNCSASKHVIFTCQIFPRLYKYLYKQVLNLSKEVCYYLHKSESFKELAQNFEQIMLMLFTKIDCPFVFMLTKSQVLEDSVVNRHKFCLLELQECMDTFCLRKDQARECLNSIASAEKQNGSNGDSMFLNHEKISMCRCLYKLIFHLMSLFESYSKVLDIVYNLNIPTQVKNMSLSVSSVKKDLEQMWMDLENGHNKLFNLDSNAETKEEVVACLIQYLTAHKYLEALQLLQLFRCEWPGDIFGVSSDDDILVLLNIYCCSFAEHNSVFVATQCDSGGPNQIATNLMELNATLSLLCSSLVGRGNVPQTV
ncbi:protein furry-like isoform X6 [Argonauta hians]